MLPLYGNPIAKADLDPASDRMPVLDVSQVADAKHRDITIKEAVEKVGDTRYRVQGTAVAWADLSGVPGSFTPTVHTHTWSEITGKPSTFPPDTHTHAWSEVSGKPTAFPPDTHTHSASDINTGTFPAARFAGTATNGFALLLVAGVPTWQQLQLATRATNLAQVFNMGSDQVLTGIDPNADRLLWWNNATKRYEYLGLGTNLSVSGGNLNASGGTGSATVDVQRFAASGNWTNPSPSVDRPVLVRLIGGGGGGGGGRCDIAGTPRCGGGGGAGGNVVEIWMSSSQLGATESVTVGAGGTAGVGPTSVSNGGDGGKGGDSIFAGVRAQGGNGGSGGTASAGAAGAVTTNGNSSTVGGQASLANLPGGAGAVGFGATPNPSGAMLPGGGGGGGGVSSANAAANGGSGQMLLLANIAVSPNQSPFPGGANGVLNVSGGGAGSSRGWQGSGGGGGGGNSSAAGFSGGNGGAYGGGGGGGGGGTTAGGNGGGGGDGYVVILTYL